MMPLEDTARKQTNVATLSNHNRVDLGFPIVHPAGADGFRARAFEFSGRKPPKARIAVRWNEVSGAAFRIAIFKIFVR